MDNTNKVASTNAEIDDRVHLLGAIVGHAVIGTACGARMQQSATGGWHSDVNYWGTTGIRKERPFTTITLDPSKVTCRRKGCKQ